MRNRTPNKPTPLSDFTPVPRKYRFDGWTPERQRAFIEALADTGSVTHAARRVNMSTEGAYYLRRQKGAESFAAAWRAALDCGVQHLEDIALERALHGVEVPVYSYGKLIGTRIVHNDRLLMFMLRNRAADRFSAGASGKRLDPPRDPYTDERPNDPHVIARVQKVMAEIRERLAPEMEDYDQWQQARLEGRTVILPAPGDDQHPSIAPEDPYELVQPDD